MRVVDIIAKKRDGGELQEAELRFLLEGYLQGEVPDYQISAWLMAVYLRGMSISETVMLTQVMLESGEQVDLSRFSRPTVDKHSTGGVGDKISLVVAPLLAASGLIVGKLTGRGLGHTGGTVDKLESIPGFSTEVSRESYWAMLEKTGLSMISAGPSLAPADKRIYALRDVTATVGCLPLIASSIMSKKLAGGAEHIVLDVKYGKGAFLPSIEQARELATLMISIGQSFGRKMRAILSDMNQPLGLAIGNSLEVQEAIAVLRGSGPADVRELSVALGAELLLSSGIKTEISAAREELEKHLSDGTGLRKFEEFVEGQGGDLTVIRKPELLPKASLVQPVPSPTTGYVEEIDALKVGHLAMLLGAGRSRKEDAIDYAAGIVLNKKRGDVVAAGEPLAFLHASTAERLSSALMQAIGAWSFSADQPIDMPLVAEVIR